MTSFPKDTAAGPSGLRIQHLFDVISVPLQTPITSSLREVVNLLVSGKAPQAVSKFMAGGRLIVRIRKVLLQISDQLLWENP